MKNTPEESKHTDKQNISPLNKKENNLAKKWNNNLDKRRPNMCNCQIY